MIHQTINNSNSLALGSVKSGEMSSREISELTNKEHKNVKRDILTMLEQLNLDALSFEHIYKDSLGREQTEYILSEELVLTLISGYSIPLRNKIIKRLKELEQASAPAVGSSEFLLMYAQRLVDIEKHHRQIESKVNEVEKLAIQANSYNSANTNFMTVRGFCNVHKLKFDLKTSQRFGKLASKLAKQYSINTFKAVDECFGEVKSYPIELLEEAYNKLVNSVVEV